MVSKILGEPIEKKKGGHLQKIFFEIIPLENIKQFLNVGFS